MKSQRINQTLLAAVAALALSSCVQELDNRIPESVMEKGLYATLASPVSGDGPETKALAADLKFYFGPEDQVNIFPKENNREIMIYGLTPDAEDGQKAGFKAQEFVLKSGDYASIYPALLLDAGADSFELSFAGQKQTANASTDHLAAYDYSWAEAAVVDNSATFGYTHKVSWIKVVLTAPMTTKFKSLVLSADNGIANTATIDAHNGAVEPVKNPGDSIVLQLGAEDGFEVKAGEAFIAYVTIPADTYTNLAVKIFDGDGGVYEKSSKKTPLTVEAGKYYTITFDSFLDMAAIGAYDNAKSNPVGRFLYDYTRHQISVGGGYRFISTKIADSDYFEYAIFILETESVVKGSSYCLNLDIEGTHVFTQTACKAEKVTSDRVWLYDETNDAGYILPIE